MAAISPEQQELNIQRLLSTDRYNKTSIPVLQECLESQVKQGWYSVEANMALLKLYQFYAGEEETVRAHDYVVLVLLKALVTVPPPPLSSDFDLALCLLPPTTRQDEKVMIVMQMAAHLEAAQFSSFWGMLASRPECAPIVKLVPGFEDAVRLNALRAIKSVYRGETPTEILSEALNLSGGKLDAFLSTPPAQAVISELTKEEEKNISSKIQPGPSSTSQGVSSSTLGLSLDEVSRLISTLR